MVEESKAPVKLSDAVSSYLKYERAPASSEYDDDGIRMGKAIKEGRDHHFSRWLWYWKQHTDENGYMVSPMTTAREWQNYLKKNDGTAAKGTGINMSNWSFTGPSSTISGYRGIGRINAMDFHPTNSNVLWIGAAGGGVWTTTNNGVSWTCLTDDLPVISVSDIDVNQKNTQTIYLCTGDRDGKDHFSMGVLKSTDGGSTWNATGLQWNTSQLRLANTLVINKVDTNALILAASDGIYKSFDGGANWNNVQPGNFKQVLYHPTDTNIVYATSFYTVANNTPAQIFRSKDGGSTWQQVTSFSQSWRITLAVTPADVKVVKAVVASYDPAKWRGLHGVYSSVDTGKNFTLLFNGNNCTDNILNNDVQGNGCTGQGNYDLAIAISPANASQVYVGGVNTWYSANGGSTWTIVNQWTGFLGSIAVVHADKHFLGFHPLISQRLFECNDGGIYWTESPQSLVWNDISNGLGITQFYRNAVADLAGYVLGGAQDNGTKSWDNTSWTDQTGGDGMDCHIDPIDPGTYYTGVQYGKIYQVSGGWPTVISDNIPGQPDGAWITPYLISPFNNYHLVAGYQRIYFTDDQGATWTLVTNGPLNPSNKNILRLAMTQASQSTIYAVIDSSNQIYYTHSFTPGNTASFTQLAIPYNGMISDIKVDPKDKDHFWITFSGFNGPQVAEYNAGSWTQINAGLPNVPVLCFEIDTSNAILYVGTDVGVFYKDSTLTQWDQFNVNLPSVHVTDLGINYVTNKIWAATYGRGMWSSPKQEYNNGISTIPYAPDAFLLFPNPNKGAFRLAAKSKAINGNVAWRLIDNMGRVARNGTGTIDGSGAMEVRATNVASGTYTFELLGDKQVLGRQQVTIFQ